MTGGWSGAKGQVFPTKGLSLGWILAILACLASLAWGGWVHWRGEQARERVARIERSLEETRAETVALRRTLAEVGPSVDAWNRAWKEGRFSSLDRRELIQRPPELADSWRVTLTTHDAPSPERIELAKGLERVTQTVRLSGSAFLDGDALSFLEALAQGEGGRLEHLSLRRQGEISRAELEAIRAGESLALITLDATLSWEGWRWRTELGPRAKPLPAPPAVPPMEGLLLDSTEEVEAIIGALKAGPWGRAPGWRDLEDLTLTGLVYAGPDAWMIWINGQPVEEQQTPAPHVVIDRVDADGVALTVDRGPEEKVTVVLKPSWTYRVFENRMDRAQ
ncbi:hypothetical protein [Rhodospirillum sp. A1_3_36]|uniref:hypothetical protein n=1 Tax=Rhodospirillum sp. A1_3_36 TaxID=3391666 RepID=UPI0039A54B7E